MADTDEDVLERQVDPAPVPAEPTAVEAAPAASVPSPSMDELAAPARPERPIDTLMSNLAANQRVKMQENARIAADTNARLAQDRARMEAAYKKTEFDPAQLPAWDAKAKAAEHRTDPIDAFGSNGMVFAMLASAFTGQPMNTALMAGAAALNAVKAGDDQAYERDFTAWKENTNLALKRHDIQRQNYNDAINLMNQNLNAGQAQLRLAATKYDDQKTLALLDAGLDQQVIELQAGRQRLADGLRDSQLRWEKDHTMWQDLKARGYDPKRAADPRQQALIRQWRMDWSGQQGAAYDAQTDFITRKKAETPDYTADDVAKWNADFLRQQAEAENTGTGGGVRTRGRIEAAEIERRKAEYVEQGMAPSEAYAKATREVSMASKTPTATRISDDKQFVDQIDTALDTIAKQKEYLSQYTGIAGAAGYVTRMGERVGNITGISSNTDRQDFEKNIEKLRLNAGRLLTMTKGRPLAAEAARINTIVAGKNFGDTGPSTTRAMEELEALYRKMRQDAVSLYTGTAPEGSTRSQYLSPGEEITPTHPGAVPASSRKRDPKRPWLNDPIVGTQ